MPESYQILESAPAPVLQNGHLRFQDTPKRLADVWVIDCDFAERAALLATVFDVPGNVRASSLSADTSSLTLEFNGSSSVNSSSEEASSWTIPKPQTAVTLMTRHFVLIPNRIAAP